MTSTIAADDLFQLTNLEDYPLRFMVANKNYAVGAGQTVYVPFDLIKLYFGDPRSGLMERSYKDEQGNRVHIPSREREVSRLTIMHGVPQKHNDLRAKAEKDGVALPPLPTLEELAPKVRIVDGSGHDIKHVIQDPLGREAVEPVSTLDSPEAIKAEVARQRQVLERLEAAQQAIDDAPTGDGEEVTEDTPDLPKGK
jgi:hypothetical protein